MNAKFLSFLLFLVCFQIEASAESKIEFFSGRAIEKNRTSTKYPGDEIQLKITGLLPQQFYKVTSVLKAPGDQFFKSWAIFVPDSAGRIDSAQMAPIRGTYQNKSVDGFFWSMIRFEKYEGVPTQSALGYTFSVVRLNNLAEANIFNPKLFESKSVGVGTENVVAENFLKLGFVSESVAVTDLKEYGFVGKLMQPASIRRGKKAPVVVAYSGSEGGAMTGILNAAALASNGIAAIGVAYFGDAGLPSQLKEIPLEYFEKVFSYIKSRDDLGEIILMGPSRGGELSLYLASHYPEVKAVIAKVPSPIRWGGNVQSNPNGTHPAAWTFKGISESFLMVVGGLEKIILPDGKVAYNNRPAFERALSNKILAEKSFSKIENVNGPILFLGGEDDQVWPSCTLSEMAMRYLAEKKHQFKDEYHCFLNAGHSVTSPPGGPTTETAMLHPHMGIYINMGGTPEGNALGQRQSFNFILDFINKHF